MYRMRLAAGLFATVSLVSLAPGASGSTPDARRYQQALSLRHDWNHLTRNVPFPAQWSDDGKTLYYVKTVPTGFTWIAFDTRTGRKSPAFAPEPLAAALGKALHRPIPPTDLPFHRFTIHPAPERITFTVHDDPWACTLTTMQCAPVDDGVRPRGFGAVRDLRVPAKNPPRPSPDGKWDVFVRDHNLVIRPRGATTVNVLSTDGSAGDFYDPESITWSPDSRHVMILRVHPGFPRYVTRVESSPPNALQPKVQTQLYPKPGDAIDKEQIVLFDITNGTQTDIHAPALANVYPLDAPEWAPDGKTLFVPFMQRGFQRAGIIAINAATGQTHLAIDEPAHTFVDGERTYHHLLGQDGARMIWASERDGWRHLYLVNTQTGGILRQITKGPWVVRDILHVDEVSHQIIFGASGKNTGEDPYFVHYYRIAFDGTGLTALTPERANHHASLSPDGKQLADTYSRIDLPGVSVLRDARTGTIQQTLEKGNDHLLRQAGFHPPEVFHTKGRDHQSEIWGIVVRPQDYDPHRKYPVIENIYAGPHDSFVPKDFWPFGYHSGGDKVVGMQELADLGFIVVQIDGMGTANRSRAFHDVAWKDLADSGFPDRILWHKAMAKKDPSYDISRVGIYGGSAGGQSTLNALLFHPEFYTVGVAFAGCYDNRMDKISWNEQWLGWPVDESYARSSGVDNARRLRGQLLMIVGEQDQNVDPASTMQVANALIKAGKTFDLLVVPGEGHTAGRSSGPIAYALRKEFGFFVKNLQGKPEPDWNALSLPLTTTP